MFPAFGFGALIPPDFKVRHLGCVRVCLQFWLLYISGLFGRHGLLSSHMKVAYNLSIYKLEWPCCLVWFGFFWCGKRLCVLCPTQRSPMISLWISTRIIPNVPVSKHTWLLASQKLSHSYITGPKQSSSITTAHLSSLSCCQSHSSPSISVPTLCFFSSHIQIHTGMHTHLNTHAHMQLGDLSLCCTKYFRL